KIPQPQAKCRKIKRKSPRSSHGRTISLCTKSFEQRPHALAFARAVRPGQTRGDGCPGAGRRNHQLWRPELSAARHLEQTGIHSGLMDCMIAARRRHGSMLTLERLPFIEPAVDRRRQSWLEQLILGLDGALRHWHSVVEYTGDPTCILRIRVGRLERDLALADGTSGRCGERFIDLHLWNEQVPPMPKHGASI